MKYLILKTLLFISLFTNGYSHPHTFIEVKPTMEIKENRVDKFHIKWILDEMTSMMMIMELDSNGNGKFEKKENDFIYEHYFISLAQYDFYMYIIENNKEVAFIPENFKASIENEKLVYTFDIKQEIDTKNLKVDFHDKELFVGMMLEKEYITIKGINPKNSDQLKASIFGVN